MAGQRAYMESHKEPEPEHIDTQAVSRRHLFQIVGAALVVAVLAGGAEMAADDPHGHMAIAREGRAALSQGPYRRKTFDDAQWQSVRVLCDLIIPSDERSGSATEAGVPEFIDDWIDFRKKEDGDDKLQTLVFGGLVWLDRESVPLCGKRFAEASSAYQTQLLDRIAWPARATEQDKPWVQFFNNLRDMTAAGFFSSKMGIADLPYLGNTAVAQWKGCDPEVWALIESRMKNGYKGLSAEAKGSKG